MLIIVISIKMRKYIEGKNTQARITQYWSMVNPKKTYLLKGRTQLEDVSPHKH
jgi:hypothetical protein